MAGLTDFQQALAALDLALTGRSCDECVHRAEQQAMSPEALYSEPGGYCLSDRGHSRVLWDNMAATLALSSLSSDEVKVAWRATNSPHWDLVLIVTRHVLEYLKANRVGAKSSVSGLL